MRSHGVWLSVVPVLLLLGACGGDGDDSLTAESLADAGDTCPVDLATAVVDAGLAADAGPAGAGDSDAGDVEVEVETGSGDGGRDDAAIDQFGGTYVECTVATGDGGDASVVIFAAPKSGAVGLLLPRILADLDLTRDDLAGIADGFDDEEAGTPVDLPGDDGPATVARIDVDGAESAVLYVSAPDGTPGQVRELAEDLLDQL